MKFLVAYKKGDKTLVKIELDDGEQVWGTTSEAVYNFAKKAFKEGEEVGVEYTEKNGQYFVNRITKKGSSETSTTKQKTTSSTGFACEDCGYELKDGKYKKCYTCNEKAPASSKKTSGDNTQEYINRQNANHATSRTLIALQGHVDPNNVLELIDTIHAKYMEKITG